MRTIYELPTELLGTAEAVYLSSIGFVVGAIYGVFEIGEVSTVSPLRPHCFHFHAFYTAVPVPFWADSMGRQGQQGTFRAIPEQFQSSLVH